jgi:hypothetical protein
MGTYEVLDLAYTPNEGQECFSGNYEECVDFINTQGGTYGACMYKIVPIINKTTTNKN